MSASPAVDSLKVEDCICVHAGCSDMCNVLLPVAMKAVATCVLRKEENNANYNS